MGLKKILSAVLSLSLLAGTVFVFAPASDAASISFKREGGVSGSAKQEGKKLILDFYDTSKVTKTTTTSGNQKSTSTKGTTTKSTKTESAVEQKEEKEIPFRQTFSFNHETKKVVQLTEKVPLTALIDTKKFSAYKGDDGKVHIVRDRTKEIVNNYLETGTIGFDLLFKSAMTNLSCLKDSQLPIGNTCLEEVRTYTPGKSSAEGTPAKVEVDPEYTVNWQVTITNQSTGESRIQHSGSSRLQMTIVFDKAGKYRIVADPVSNKGNVNWNGGRRVFEIEIEEDDVGKPIPFPSGGSPGTNTVGKDVFLSGGGAVKGNNYNKDNASNSGAGDRDWSWRSNGVRIKEVSR